MAEAVMCGADCIAIALPRRGIYVCAYIYIARWKGKERKGEGSSNVTRGTRAATRHTYPLTPATDVQRRCLTRRAAPRRGYGMVCSADADGGGASHVRDVKRRVGRAALG